MLDSELTIERNIRNDICLGDKCSLKRAFELVSAKSEAEEEISLGQIQKICEGEGLVSMNEYYRNNVIAEHMPYEKIYTADCVAGLVESPDLQNCGSVMVIKNGLVINRIKEIVLVSMRYMWRTDNF